MKHLFAYIAALALGVLATVSFTSHAAPNANTWQLAYAHDATGKTTEGSKEALIKAVTNGKPVRVYWAGRRVQHTIDASILTVLEGEVFAQMPTITAQKPSVDPAAITLRDGTWQTVFATNGDRALKWFVQY